MSGSTLEFTTHRTSGPGAGLVWRFLTHRAAVVSSIVLIVLILAVVSAPLMAYWLEIDPERTNLLNRFAPPSAQHPLGTDDLGRDLLLRLLYGGQVSLLIGLSGALLAAFLGTLIGVAAGLVGGWLDSLLMRFTDGIISLPILPLLIIFAAIDLGKLGIPGLESGSDSSGVLRIIAIVALFGWTTVARIVRGTVLSLKEREFVIAARAMGAGPMHLVLRHLLPNTAAPIMVATTLSIGNVVLVESILSFLGLGVQPPTPSWGNMLTNAQELIWSAPQLAVLPGLLIFIAVVAFNFIGDGLQDALDPRLLRR